MKKITYKEKFKSFYNTRLWKKLRALKFADANGQCEICMSKGNTVREGVDVHHIVPIDKDWSKRYDYNNLILLCKNCHAEQHDRESPLQKFLKEWEDL